MVTFAVNAITIISLMRYKPFLSTLLTIPRYACHTAPDHNERPAAATSVKACQITNQMQQVIQFQNSLTLLPSAARRMCMRACVRTHAHFFDQLLEEVEPLKEKHPTINHDISSADHIIKAGLQVSFQVDILPCARSFISRSENITSCRTLVHS